MRSSLDRVVQGLEDSTVLWHEPLSRHTSFRIGGPCEMLVLPRTAVDAAAVWTGCLQSGVPCRIIGHGTNLLVKDGGVRGCIIKMAPDFRSITKKGDLRLEVASGTLLSVVVEEARNQGLSGLEWAVGIPGSIGGAVTMNAGAYGGDIASIARRVKVASPGGDLAWINGPDLDFGYRHSLFSDREDVLIVSAEFELVLGDKAEIRDLMHKRSSERAEKQPLEFPSAGSVFRRPQGHYVGAMVQELGLKGVSRGGAQISPKHGGFIVNTGGATAEDVLSLIRLVKAAVKDRYDVDLESEIIVLGEDLPPGGTAPPQ